VAYRATTALQGAGLGARGILDQAVRETLDRGDIRFAVQSVVPLKRDQRPNPWVELLVRPFHDLASLPAQPFIDRAAEMGLARPLDLLVLRTGLRWLNSNPGISLCSINVSGQSISNPAFLDEVLALVDRAGVDPARLCLELTETVPIENFSSARRFAARLREAGCHMALDDFGTGSSNLMMLVPMEMDFLKIDGRFIRHVPNRSDHTNLVRGVVAFAEAVGLRTVAECVETGEQHKALAGMGVDFIQGYYKEGAPEIAQVPGEHPSGWERPRGPVGVKARSNGATNTGD